MAQAAQTIPATQQDFEKILKVKDAEINILKEKLAAMESDVAQIQKLKTQRAKENEEVQVLKIQSEGILTKAKAMIFENTKVIKNQELQLDALGQQNESLKDVVHITKDLLEIRNLEIKQLEAKIQCMEDRVKAEKTRQDLLHKKLETMIRHNGELKREYEAQLCLFNALRQRYSEKELAQGVVSELRSDVAEARAEQIDEASTSPNEASENQTTTESQINVVEGQSSEVAESQTTVAENQTTVAENKTTVAENQTTVAENKTTVAENQTTVAESQTTVAESQTTVGESQTTVAESQTNAVAESQASVVAESETNVVAENQASVVAKSQANVVAENQASVVAESQARIVAESQTKEVSGNQTNEGAKGQTNQVIESQTNKIAESQAKAEEVKDGK